MDYQHLTQNQRYQIQVLFAEGFGPTAIGKRIGRHKSTISRELNRNSDEQGYRAAKAQNSYHLRLQAKGVERQPWRRVWNELAVPLITEGWSPAQISGVFANSECPVSHEWLYQGILADKLAGGTLYKHLRCQKLRKKRYGKPDRRGMIKNRVSISERPAEVETREEEGHWEADLVMGSAHQGALVTLVERKTGFMKTLAVPSKEAKGVTKAIIKMLKPLGDQVKSITFDNGKEFAGHEEIAKALSVQCYFADPYSSWQRGSNENTNGLIRQYYPKKNSNFSKVTREEIANLEKRLNNRPRKRLGFRSPAQVFNKGKSLN